MSKWKPWQLLFLAYLLLLNLIILCGRFQQHCRRYPGRHGAQDVHELLIVFSKVGSIECKPICIDLLNAGGIILDVWF